MRRRRFAGRCRYYLTGLRRLPPDWVWLALRLDTRDRGGYSLSRTAWTLFFLLSCLALSESVDKTATAGSRPSLTRHVVPGTLKLRVYARLTR